MSPITQRVRPSMDFFEALEFEDAIISESASGMQPVLVVCATIASLFIVLLMLVPFLIWHQRRLRARMYEPRSKGHMVPGALYHRRAARKSVKKHVRWHTMSRAYSPPQSATSTIHLFSDDDAAVRHSGTPYAGYGTTTKRASVPSPSVFQGINISTWQRADPLLNSPYRDMQLTSTTIESAPMSAMAMVITPPIPRRSSARRPPPLNLRSPQPEMKQHSSHLLLTPNHDTRTRQATPYPLSTQLTPAEPGVVHGNQTHLFDTPVSDFEQSPKLLLSPFPPFVDTLLTPDYVYSPRP